MSDSDLSDVEKLLRLKRYERPPEGYYEDFLLEFQHRQRAEMLRRSAFSLWTEKVANWFWGFGSSKWVVGGAAVYASLMIFAYLNNDPVESLQAGEGESATGSSAAEQVGLSPTHPNGSGGGELVQPVKQSPGSSNGGKVGQQGVSVSGFREL